MNIDTELQFLRQVCQKSNVHTQIAGAEEPERKLDLGLRGMLGRDDEYEQYFRELLAHLEPGILYRLADIYRCSYLFAKSPELGENAILVVGPFLTMELTHEELLEQAGQHNMTPECLRAVEHYYSDLAVLLPGNPLYFVLETFLEHLWGTGFEAVDINQQLTDRASPLSVVGESPSVVDPLWAMQMMERRYAYENELMQAVTQGQQRKAEQLIGRMSELAFERRMLDPVRNLKNYCIIMNTLFRKAAEQGGVHPLYLDQVSSEFAKTIEQLRTTSAVQEIMDNMTQAYCSLVSKHAMRHYSPPVQRAVVYIDANLAGDLSLKTLSAAQNINASYLSSLFKKETGQTITEFVNRKWVKRALRLLGTTNLQIQTVAQHCGIPDVNYFCKIFKKFTDLTPKEYRRSIRS